MRELINVIYWITWKDLRCELRNRENLAAMLFFALNILLVFSFSFAMDDLTAILPGLIWTAFGFTSIVGLGRSFVPEVQNDCVEYYQILPVHKGAIYLGKLVGNLVFMTLVGLALVPLLVLFFNIDLGGAPWILLLIFLAGMAGLAILGTLFSALTSRIRAREVMFPLLLLPLSVPVFIGAVEATRGALAGDPLPLYRHWIDLLLIFDGIFVIVAFWISELILDD